MITNVVFEILLAEINMKSSQNLPVTVPLCSELNYPDDVVVDFLYFNVLPDGALDVLQDHDASLVVHQAGDVAVGDASHPAHSAYPVNVVSGVEWKVVVDDVTEIKTITSQKTIKGFEVIFRGSKLVYGFSDGIVPDVCRIDSSGH